MFKNIKRTHIIKYHLQELKQHPVFMTEFDETKPMSEAMEGLQALKYESNDNDGGFLCGALNFENKNENY